VKVADAAAQEATVTIHTQSSIAMMDDDCRGVMTVNAIARPQWARGFSCDE
jgi:hypothetical protein